MYDVLFEIDAKGTVEKVFNVVVKHLDDVLAKMWVMICSKLWFPPLFPCRGKHGLGSREHKLGSAAIVGGGFG